MALVRKRMQSIVLPFDESFSDCERLFISPDMGLDALEYEPIKGGIPRVEYERLLKERAEERSRPVHDKSLLIDRELKALSINDESSISFCTYLNTCSLAKWKTLTNAKDFFLRLEAEGNFILVINQFFMDEVEKKEDAYSSFKTLRMEAMEPLPVMLDGRGTFELPLGDSTCDVIGFEVYAAPECKIFGGTYEALIDDADLQEVDILISSTTFKKEEFIKRNIGIIEREIFEAGDEVSDHLRMFVVDNGRTLDASCIENDHMKVFGNINAGGSGGFARGMMEALRLERKPTHILLMDDDVLFMAESFKRTYSLLSMLKEEYRGCFLSGAMLELENKQFMHEDAGCFFKEGFYGSKKGQRRDMTDLHMLVQNEVPWVDFGHEYAAWWFCCIPVRYISDSTLPIPFFVRCDDVEFSLRNNPGILSLNGISVWHMGFGQKFSASMEFYQVVRNSLVMQAFLDNCDDIKVFERAKQIFHYSLSKYAYSHADLVLDAVEDFLEGPSILDNPNGAETIREKSKKNEVLSPIDEFGQYASLIDDEYTYGYHSLPKRIVLSITLNGYGLPEFLMKDEVGHVDITNVEPVGKYFLNRRILAIDSVNRMAIMREYDAGQLKQVYERGLRVFGRYQREHRQVEAAYRAKADYYRSIDFWSRYLGVETQDA